MVFILSSFMTITAFAASPASQDGITATLTSSKTTYAANEDIDLSLTVTNNSAYAVDGIQTAISLPDSITAKAGSLTQNAFSLAAGESKSSTLTVIKATNSKSPQTGDSSMLWLWFSIMLISGGIFFFLMAKNRKIKSKGVLSLFLCFAMLGTVCLPITANAASTQKSFTITKNLTVDGKAVTVSAEIFYGYIIHNTVTVTDGTGSSTYARGDTVAITANTPKTGYHFANWTVVSGGVTLVNDKDSTTKFTMPGKAVEVKANYEINTYTITATTDSNGTVSPQGSSTVNYGDSKRFDFTANAGYHIKDVTVDGTSVGAVTSYTFDNVTADHTINVTTDRTINVTFIPTVRSTQEVTEKFVSYFYDESGNVKCNKLEGFSSAEWAVGSKNGILPLEVFKDITGMDVVTTDTYSYKFVSSDGQSTIMISGTTSPGDNSEYATMTVSIPSCSVIQTIHIGSPQYFNGTNEEDVPVIFIHQ